MNGIKAAVFLPAAADLQAVGALIEDSFQTMEATHSTAGNDIAFDGTLEKRRFIVRCGLDYAERFEDLDFQGLSDALGWPPVDEVRIAALHDTPEDHHLLARACIALVEKFGGIVDLGGKHWELSDDAITAIGGKLILLPEFDGGEPLSDDLSCAYGDAEFLKAWLRHPAFKMAG
jgi:hypothetical protein